jgi:hypothetical protein
MVRYYLKTRAKKVIEQASKKWRKKKRRHSLFILITQAFMLDMNLLVISGQITWLIEIIS